MTAPSMELLESMLDHKCAEEVHRQLKQRGYTVTRATCEKIRRRIMRDRDAGRSEAIRSGYAYTVDITVDGPRGCEALEVAMCNLYAHTAKRRGCSFETAAILLNHSPAAIQADVARRTGVAHHQRQIAAVGRGASVMPKLPIPSRHDSATLGGVGSAQL